MEDFVDIERTDNDGPALGMEQFLEFIHEVTYNITEQLFDNLDKVLEVHVRTYNRYTMGYN